MDKIYLQKEILVISKHFNSVCGFWLNAKE
jgi:hypothetical protein